MTLQMLGDLGRKAKYDPNLAGALNNESVEEERVEKPQEVTPPIPETVQPSTSPVQKVKPIKLKVPHQSLEDLIGKDVIGNEKSRDKKVYDYILPNKYSNIKKYST